MKRILMLAYVIKRQTLYRTPSFVMGLLGDKRGIYWVFESVHNKSNNSRIPILDVIRIILGLIAAVITFPVALVYYGVTIVGGRLYIPRIELELTTHCSLKCKDCTHLISYYKHPYHIDTDLLIADLSIFLQYIDELEQLVLLGGEPFLHPGMKQIVQFAIKEKKVKTINIITNAIFKVDREDLDYLKDEKIRLTVSDYGHKSEIVNRNIQLFDELGIKYYRNVDKKWLDFGNFQKRNRSTKDLQRQYIRCRFKCKGILNGKLYVCSRASHAEDLGLFRDESVNLRENNVEDMKRRIVELYYKDKPIPACDYCDAGTDYIREIESGIQV